MNTVKLDIHAKLMKSYKQVPQWWFLILLAGSIGISLLMSFVWKEDVQLPWWGMLFAFGLAFIVTLPIGVIQATTNQVADSKQFSTGLSLIHSRIASDVKTTLYRTSNTITNKEES